MMHRRYVARFNWAVPWTGVESKKQANISPYARITFHQIYLAQELPYMRITLRNIYRDPKIVRM